MGFVVFSHLLEKQANSQNAESGIVFGKEKGTWEIWWLHGFVLKKTLNHSRNERIQKRLRVQRPETTQEKARDERF